MKHNMTHETKSKLSNTLRASRNASGAYDRLIPTGVHLKLRKRIAALRENVASKNFASGHGTNRVS